MQEAWIIGADAGGTRTRVLVSTLDGRRLGLGLGAGGNLKSAGPHQAVAELRKAAITAGLPLGAEVRAVVAGFAGAGDRARSAAAARALAESWPAARVTVMTDLELALQGALAGEPGIIIVCGTGSAACGRNATGEFVRAGGWGPLLDDRGSGFDIGFRALRSAAFATDGRGPAPSFMSGLLQALEIERIAEVQDLLMKPGFSRTLIAGLAPIVTAAAEGGDPLARRILEHAAQDLLVLAQTVARQLGPSPTPIALVGGVVENSPLLREMLESRIALEMPGTGLCHPREQAVFAALASAAGLAGSPFPSDLRQQLARVAESALQSA